MKTSAVSSLLLSSVFGFLSVGCCAPAPDRPVSPELRAHWSGPHSSAKSLATLVVRTADEWTALWRRIGSEPPQAFDASNDMAVAVFLGERRTGGYAVELLELRLSGSTLHVTYRERPPGSDVMVPQVITSPWTVGILNAVNSPVDFVAIKATPNAKP